LVFHVVKWGNCANFSHITPKAVRGHTGNKSASGQARLCMDNKHLNFISHCILKIDVTMESKKSAVFSNLSFTQTQGNKLSSNLENNSPKI